MCRDEHPETRLREKRPLLVLAGTSEVLLTLVFGHATGELGLGDSDQLVDIVGVHPDRTAVTQRVDVRIRGMEGDELIVDVVGAVELL